MTENEAWESLKRAHQKHAELCADDRFQMPKRSTIDVPCEVVSSKPLGHEQGQEQTKHNEQCSFDDLGW